MALSIFATIEANGGAGAIERVECATAEWFAVDIVNPIRGIEVVDSGTLGSSGAAAACEVGVPWAVPPTIRITGEGGVPLGGCSVCPTRWGRPQLSCEHKGNDPFPSLPPAARLAP